MAVTNGWGQAAKNNTNGYGKLATNNIGAGSIYEDSYTGDTALIGVSAAFSYSAASFTQADSNPTPTITGTTGGVFSGTSGLVFVSTSTGEINLSASTIASHVVTYTVGGVSADFSLSVTAAPFANQFSFEFDGVDEDFLTGLNLANTDFTISYWLNANGSYTGNKYVAPMSVQPGSQTVGQTLGALYKRPNLHAVHQGLDSSGGNYGTYTATNVNLEGAGWKHILWTFNNSTRHAYCYIDGQAQTFTKQFGSGTTDFFTVQNFTFGDVFIGSFINAANYFPGLIDEVSVFNSVLSQTDINTIYGTGSPSDLSTLNPIGWWRMGEEATFNSGTGVWTMVDQGSGGNNATSNNMEEADRKTNTPASFNQFSFEFDGVDEGFTIGNPTELQLTNNISISGWFKTSSTSVMNLFTKRASGINNWAVYMQSGKIYFWVSKDGTSVPVQVQSASTLNDGNWHFFAGVREGTSLKLYIDNLSPVTGTVASGSLGNPNGTVMIAETAVNSFRFNGNLDELAIFDYDLSGDNIDTIYGTGQPSSLSTLNPVAWYRMGEKATFSGGSWTLTDQGSGGNNATSNNMEEADRKADTP